MNRETRTVRPFHVPPTLERVLEQASLGFGDLDCRANERIVIDDPADFLRRSAQIRWAGDDPGFASFQRAMKSGIQDLKLDPANAALLVQVRSRYLGVTEELLRHPLDDLGSLPRICAFPERKGFRAANRGFAVTAWILLSRSIGRRPGRPWRKGTWLAKATFHVATDWFAGLFRPTPLDRTTREEYGLPASAMRYLHLGDHDPLESYKDTEQPTFFVDEELLSKLDAWSGSPFARAIQLQLVQDFVSAVVHRSATRLSKRQELPAWSDIDGAVLGRMLRLAAKTEEDRAHCLQEARDQPVKLIARIEHATGIRKEFIDAAAEGGK